MVRRRQQNGVRGPQSALTDYLASHNIVARDITASAHARREAARQAAEEAAAQADDGETNDNVEIPETGASSPLTSPIRATRQTRGRIQQEEDEDEDEDVAVENDDDYKEDAKSAKKAKTKAAIEKIRKEKEMKKRKRNDDGSDNDDLAGLLADAAKRAPLPGQMDYCANTKCNKRFTVTPYTRADADGNLLCPTHSKELDASDKKGAPKKKPRVTGAVGSRRKTQSAILDGANYLGAKNLLTLCIEQLAKNIDLADDLGSLPDAVVDRIARMLSKRRLIKAETLQLFARPEVETLSIYSGSKLSTSDVMSVFQTCPNLKHFKLYDGIAFKDEVMDYLIGRNINLESIYLHGANLISEDKWLEYLTAKGEHLTSLKISFTDKHVTDKLVNALPKLCPNLERLKITHNEQVTGKGVKALVKCKKLEHFSIYLQKGVEPEDLDVLLAAIGPQLKTFSVCTAPNFNNFLLTRMMTECRALKKLRITGSEELTDSGFAQFFNGWTSNHGLEFIDFQKCRHLESSEARSNPDNIGLGPEGFVALMEHSGDTLHHLNLHACRFITAEAFEKVFNKNKVYPNLRFIELSNCEMVTDMVVEAIFRSCPALHELLVFGCFKVRDARVPSGRLLVGVPNAVGMVTEGA